MSILGALFYIEKIVFDEGGMTFQRKFRPITIREITGLEIIKRGGAEGLKITGLTPDDRKIRKNIWRGGGVGKRWEEFKDDLQKIRPK